MIQGEIFCTGGGSMSESRNCHHRFSLHAETIGFTTNDGLDVFNAGTRFQKSITYSHMELPVDTNELIEATQIEKRNNLFAPKNMFVTLMSL